MLLIWSLTGIILILLHKQLLERNSTMKKFFTTLTVILIALFVPRLFGEEPMKELVQNQLTRCAEQYRGMAQTLEKQPGKFPRTIDAKENLLTGDAKVWTSGYFPGSLWYLYEFSGDKEFLEYAKESTSRIKGIEHEKGYHDIGLMLYCSFGNGYRLTGDTVYRDILLTGAESLSTRFNPVVGCTKSWEPTQNWKFPVIIDNMVCLELMLWASEASGNSGYKDICVSHADVTIKNHFRPDFSSYHLVSYIPGTGEVEKKVTVQGYANESSWARGQAWGLHGYTMMYRMTKEPRFLKQAQNIAAFILNHPNLPADKIPYWDFNAPDIPNALRDASAAALIASALVELSGYVEKPLAKTYLKTAETQIRTLSSPGYFAEKGTNGHFILKHSVGSLPHKSEIDVPLTYADYYYIEAMMRYRTLMSGK
jgi:hypothetical protein